MAYVEPKAFPYPLSVIHKMLLLLIQKSRSVMLWGVVLLHVMGCANLPHSLNSRFEVMKDQPGKFQIDLPQTQILKDHPSMTTSSPYSESKWERWHLSRVDRLSKEDGWLSLVGLDFLPTTVGESLSLGGDDADLSPEGFGLDRLGNFELRADGWWFRAHPNKNCTFNGESLLEGRLQTDAQGAPTQLRVGGGLLILIERGGQVALRSRHPEAMARTKFSGIPCWPWLNSAVVTGLFVPAESGDTFQATNALGEIEQTTLGGTVRFIWPSSNKEEELAEPATYELIGTPNGDGSLFVVFADTTSGGQSYGGGRFLVVSAPDANGEVTIDFNRSVNPPCAFTPFATCPRPPQQNRLPFPVTAGEKTPREH